MVFADNAVAAATRYVSTIKLNWVKKIKRMENPSRLPAIMLDQKGIHG